MNKTLTFFQIVVCAAIVGLIIWLLWPVFKVIGAIISGIVMTALLFWGWITLWNKISPWVGSKIKK